MSDTTQSGYMECPSCRGAGCLYCGGTGKVEKNTYMGLQKFNCLDCKYEFEVKL